MTLAEPPKFPRRLVYMGTPDVAVPPLVALHTAGFEIPLVVSRKDKRRGRGKALMPSPVKAKAIELGLSVTDQVDDCLTVEADAAIVVAYGRLIKRPMLEALPMLNIHFSMLPRWRGAAPVERAILAGDERTGVCLTAIEEELDTGAIFRSIEVDIEQGETLDQLRGRLVELGCELLVDQLTEGLGQPTVQHGEVSYAHKIENHEYELDFTRAAIELERVVRLGRAWTTFRNRRLKVLSVGLVDDEGASTEIVSVDGPTAALGAGELQGQIVGTGSGRLRLLEVQPEGKKPMVASSWLNGVQLALGERLG